MPNYVNLSSGYPNAGSQMYSQPFPQYPQYQPVPQQPGNPTMIWVDGEAAARAYQIPPTHPIGLPIALWDNNDMVIYLKSVDSFGRPAPLKKIRYTVEPEQQMSSLPSPVDHQANNAQYATKDDFENFKNEIREMMQYHGQGQNQNQNNNRGGKQ